MICISLVLPHRDFSFNIACNMIIFRLSVTRDYTEREKEMICVSLVLPHRDISYNIDCNMNIFRLSVTRDYTEGDKEMKAGDEILFEGKTRKNSSIGMVNL